MKKTYYIGLLYTIIFVACTPPSRKKSSNTAAVIQKDSIQISRATYHNQLMGFWLGQCIGNWTGLVTEMDKIGNIGEIQTGSFYNRNDWNKPDLPSIWGEGVPSDLSENIDFVLRDSSEVWGADDDTDIEYMYQELLYKSKQTRLTPQTIRQGWLHHIKEEEENFLWVANQKAYDLMKTGMLPPNTGAIENNEHYEMIDAQLTTEIFGLYTPAQPSTALKIADLPIQTVARKNAYWIAQFYVAMHALASKIDHTKPIKTQTQWMAHEARKVLPNNSYAAKMFDYVVQKHQTNIPWEQTRDSIYTRYQVAQKDGYTLSSQKLYCNGCFAAGINFAASLISWFYGEGDFKETLKIGTLAGWDSDNPTATWGGLLGFIYGKNKIEQLFTIPLSNQFNIHRTRQNFDNNGIDNFDNMARKGIQIIDKMVVLEMNGRIDKTSNTWVIPLEKNTLKPTANE